MSETNENVLGTLETSEQEKLSTLRQNAQMLVSEIGQIEVRKARLLGALSEVEGRAQEELGAIGKRLGVPDGKAWQVTPEGTALLVEETASPSATA
jgi:hypothetical protein